MWRDRRKARAAELGRACCTPIRFAGPATCVAAFRRVADHCLWMIRSPFVLGPAFRHTRSRSSSVQRFGIPGRVRPRYGVSRRSPSPVPLGRPGEPEGRMGAILILDAEASARMASTRSRSTLAGPLSDDPVGPEPHPFAGGPFTCEPKDHRAGCPWLRWPRADHRDPLGVPAIVPPLRVIPAAPGKRSVDRPVQLPRKPQRGRVVTPRDRAREAALQKLEPLSLGSNHPHGRVARHDHPPQIRTHPAAVWPPPVEGIPARKPASQARPCRLAPARRSHPAGEWCA